jgi:hypothetical protein
MPAWGVGKVMKIAQGGNLLVRFAQGGKKLLKPGHAHLKKIEEDELLFLVIREIHRVRGKKLPRTRFIPIVRSDES